MNHTPSRLRVEFEKLFYSDVTTMNKYRVVAQWAFEKAAEEAEKLDPLLAEGNFWEDGSSDDIAHGVQEYVIENLRQLGESLK